MRCRPIGALTLVLALCGCKNEHDVYEQENTDTWQQAPTDQVDILFVIDDSHSMSEEQSTVATGFTSFISEIENTATDFHLGVITTSFEYSDPDRGKLIGEPAVLTRDTPDYVSMFQERVQVGTLGSDKEKGLEAAEHALSTVMTNGANAGFLRPDAYLLVVVVSDENDCSDEGATEGMPATACYDNQDLLAPVEGYVDSFRELKSDPAMVHYGVIVGPKAGTGSCDDATPGHRYMEMANALGGLVGNICDADYASIMYDLGLQASGVVSSFQLSDPAQPDTIVVTVRDAAGTEWEVPPGEANGWTYDEESHYLTFHGDAVPPRASWISATYTLRVGG